MSVHINKFYPVIFLCKIFEFLTYIGIIKYSDIHWISWINAVKFWLSGTISPDYLRDKLKTAMESKDKDALDKAIRTSIAAGMPDLEVDIQEARRMSDILAGGDGG